MRGSPEAVGVARSWRSRSSARWSATSIVFVRAPEELGDLPHLQVRAVAERDQLAVAVAESSDRGLDRHPLNRVAFEVVTGSRSGADAPPGSRCPKCSATQVRATPKQPRLRGALLPVVGIAEAQCAFERVVRDVLCIGPIADPVRDVGVHALNQRLRAPEWISPQHRQGRPKRAIRQPRPPGGTGLRGLNGYRRLACANAFFRALPLETFPRSSQAE